MTTIKYNMQKKLKKVYRRRSDNCIYSNVALSIGSHCSSVKLSYRPGESTNMTDIGTAYKDLHQLKVSPECRSSSESYWRGDQDIGTRDYQSSSIFVY